MNLDSPMTDALSRYLDLSVQQMKVTAGNMANIDTPGFKTQGFDFEREFARSIKMQTSAAPAAASVDGLVARADGNNVSMDRESMQMAKTQLGFRTAVELLKHQYSQMMDAIRSEGGK